MPVRNIITIDEDKCDGCGLCISACAEGALQLVDGKARLVSDTYCDGLGACLGECPQGAITVVQREAAEFDEAAVEQHLATIRPKPANKLPTTHACPGSAMRMMQPRPTPVAPNGPSTLVSQLAQWPVQLTLVPPTAPYLQTADLLICADCVPFAVPDFHSRYLAGRAVVVGCPKLDDLQAYFEKLCQIFECARPRSLTVLKMVVPCCGGIAQAALMARDRSGLHIPLEVHTIGIEGDISVDQLPAGSTRKASGMQ